MLTVKKIWAYLKVSVFCLAVLWAPQMAQAQDALQAFSGEKITYSIRKFGLKLGNALLRFDGPVKVNGQEGYLVIFKATALDFLDEEKIYIHPVTLLPFQVERDLNIFGSKERIVEYYENGRVRVVKTKAGKTTEQVIEKREKPDNIYCFIFRYRLHGPFSTEGSFRMNLPTREVTIRMKGEAKISTAGKNFDAYVLESNPAQYTVWFDKGAQKIPLRIDGATGIASTSLVMSEYTKR